MSPMTKLTLLLGLILLAPMGLASQQTDTLTLKDMTIPPPSCQATDQDCRPSAPATATD